ncbi:MAG: hypothetical protein FWH08_00370 [Oscillospiraceae bacterium]|nr:hypothetical protein [Oscillospiraceae bacterium]
MGLISLQGGFTPTEIAAKAVILGFLVFISVRDMRFHKIDNFVHPVIMAISFFVFDIPLTGRLIGAAVGFIPFFVAALTTGKMGMGDAKLLMSFGFMIGTTCVFAAIIGLLIMLCTAGTHQFLKRTKKPVALAPFLCVGFIVVVIFI